MARNLKRVVGALIGIFYFGVASFAFRTSLDGWNAGQADIGFWWGVIGSLLAIAGLSALIGTWIHTRTT
ncbi:MAG: hypothetical protein HY704_16145 [Gemmatimonadetes bacterium]|nr:hypothetical protein [Gemmatimonadota bacterium]